MKYAVYISMLVLFIFCSKKNLENKIRTINNTSKFYKNDSANLSILYLKNIEYFREFHYFKDILEKNSGKSTSNELNEAKLYLEKYPDANWDPANFFEPLGLYYDYNEEDYKIYPTSIEKNLKTAVDTIIYNKDSTLCVALMVTSKIFNEKEKYNGNAVIGYRKNIKENFEIYPFVMFSASAKDYKTVSESLRYDYFNSIRGKWQAGSLYEPNKYIYNLGDKYFFEKSLFFQKYKKENNLKGLYNFQIYRHLGNDFSYKYLRCDGSVTNKDNKVTDSAKFATLSHK